MISLIRFKQRILFLGTFVFLHTSAVCAKEDAKPYHCDQQINFNLEKQLNQQMQSMTSEQAKFFVEQHGKQLAQSAFCRYQLQQQTSLAQKNKHHTASDSNTGFTVQQNTIAQGDSQ